MEKSRIAEERMGFELRSAALDIWCLHLLRCATCARPEDLCGTANELVALLGDRLAYDEGD